MDALINELRARHTVDGVCTVTIDAGRVVKRPSESYECAICTNLKVVPFVFANCGHDVCQPCVTHMIDVGGSSARKKLACPMCRTVSDPRHLCMTKYYELQTRNTTIKCEHEECTAVYQIGIDYAGIFAHQAICAFTKVRCSLCKEMVLNSGKAHHDESTCVNRDKLVQCATCDQFVKMRDQAVHETGLNDLPCIGVKRCDNGCGTVIRCVATYMHQLVCTDATVSCSYCNIDMKRAQYKRHMSENEEIHRAISASLVAQSVPVNEFFMPRNSSQMPERHERVRAASSANALQASRELRANAASSRARDTQARLMHTSAINQ